MKDSFIIALVLVGIVLLLGMGAACNVMIWGECRDAGHSFFYCTRMLGR